MANVDGLENRMENFVNIAECLVRLGFSDAPLVVVLGANIMCALADIRP